MFFDTTRMELIALKEIQPGDELVFSILPQNGRWSGPSNVFVVHHNVYIAYRVRFPFRTGSRQVPAYRFYYTKTTNIKTK